MALATLTHNALTQVWNNRFMSFLVNVCGLALNEIYNWNSSKQAHGPSPLVQVSTQVLKALYDLSTYCVLLTFKKVQTLITGLGANRIRFKVYLIHKHLPNRSHELTCSNIETSVKSWHCWSHLSGFHAVRYGVASFLCVFSFIWGFSWGMRDLCLSWRKKVGKGIWQHDRNRSMCVIT